jgi:hypothetical protein
MAEKPRRNAHVDDLMGKLTRAIELSLAAADASREAVLEILRRGGETGIFFREAGPAAKAGGAGATPGTASRKSQGAAAEGLTLTQQDRDFLRALSIRPDPTR